MPITYADTTPASLAHAVPAWPANAMKPNVRYSRAHYASVAELAAAADIAPDWYKARPSTGYKTARDGFPGSARYYGSNPYRSNGRAVPTLAEAVRFLTEGSPEMTQRANDAAARLEAATVALPMLTRRSMAGGRPVVALAVAGDPCHMLTRSPAPRGVRTVDLACALFSNSGCHVDAFTIAAIVAAAITARLEASRYRVGLTGVWRTRDNHDTPCARVVEVAVTLKAPNENMDAGTLAVTAGHAWLARRLCFVAALADETNSNDRSIGGNVGYPKNSYAPRSATNPDTAILLPQPHEYSDALEASRLCLDATSARALARCLALAVESFTAQTQDDPNAPRLDPVAWQDVAD